MLFALAARVRRFHYLKYALAAVLVFIGVKIPSPISLSMTFGLLLASALYSLSKTHGEPIPEQ